MKSDILYDKTNGTAQESISLILRTLTSIQHKLEKDVESTHQIIQWQQGELKRLQGEILEKNNAIADLNTKLHDCESQSVGNRQLINKLITDIDRLQQAIEWYRRTYETRSLAGIIKDKLKHFFIR
jgi:predicted  nucleic acid-binding Zn-ribbon protein